MSMNPSTRKMHKPTRYIKAKAIQWQMGEGREEVTGRAKLVASLSEVPQTVSPPAIWHSQPPLAAQVGLRRLHSPSGSSSCPSKPLP